MRRSHRSALFVVAVLCAACGGGHPYGPAARYSAIAKIGNAGLEVAFTALDGPDKNNLAAARSDLDRAAATERTFDRGLLAIPLPPAIEATARAVVGVNEARANLATMAAASETLEQLRGYDPRLSAANDAVVRQVRILRSQLGLPPPETS